MIIPQGSTSIDTIEDVFKTLIWDNVIAGALAALFAWAPFLAIPGIKQAITFIVTKFSDFIFNSIKTVVDLTIIKFKNDAAREKYDKASVILKIYARDYGTESKEFKDARENAKKALADFISYDNFAVG